MEPPDTPGRFIDGATDDRVSASNLLRKVLVVAHRLGSEELQKWVHDELNGYADVSALPPYRRIEGQVQGVYSGVLYEALPQALSTGQIPEEAAEVLFSTRLTVSVAELEELARPDSDREMGVPWDVQQIAMYNGWAEQRLVPRINGHSLRSANRVITRGMLRGVIDATRNTALGLALDLQATAPDAGMLGGPTMAQAPVAHVVNNYYSTHIEGHGNQVAQGENIRQRTKVVQGDLSSLLKAAREVGLDSDASAALARVVLADTTERPSKVQAFLSRVREGTIQIGTGITAEVAAARLSELITAYLG